MSEPHAMDASALVALSLGEIGSELVREHVEGSFVSAVNLAEVVAKLEEKGFEPGEVKPLLAGLGFTVIDFDENQAFEVGRLRKATRSSGLSLGDRACIVISRILGVPVLTADRAFLNHGTPEEMRLIR